MVWCWFSAAAYAFFIDQHSYLWVSHLYAVLLLLLLLLAGMPQFSCH
jgi:hypothetical protein